MSGYTSLNVWHRAMDLAAGVYDVARLLPKTEQFGMTSQLQRAVASVPANIAEGYQRGSRKDYARFIAIARGSLAGNGNLPAARRSSGPPGAVRDHIEPFTRRRSQPNADPAQASPRCSARPQLAPRPALPLDPMPTDRLTPPPPVRNP
ncbi:four helix bundle protein [Brevundimonas sp. FT23042]|uniref:four helix bundle protein n=1 Tax=Brevundimonas sp. FT23042 TaxID=3393749 RepID=UPI003B5875C4